MRQLADRFFVEKKEVLSSSSCGKCKTVHALLILKNDCASLKPSDMVHSPRNVFEQACGERNSLEYLRSRNLAYLKSENYKKVMKQGWFDCRWYLWKKDPS